MLNSILIIVLYFIIVYVNFKLIKKANMRNIELEMACQLLAIFPFINIFSYVITLGVLNNNRLKEEERKKKELASLNSFKECASCKMIVRSGYIKNYKCPICKQKTNFTFYGDNYVPSEKIQEQKEIKNLEEFKKEILLEKTVEQELQHLKILEERLKNKDL